MAGRIQQEFEGYLEMAYASANRKRPMPPEQKGQLRDAFFGGALVAYTEGSDLGPELLEFMQEVKVRALGKEQADA